MADQQIPLQGDAQIPVQNNTQDLLGSISIDLPQAPAEESVTSSAPVGDTVAIASPSDTLSADLGSITLPEAPVAEETSPILVEPNTLDISPISPEATTMTPESTADSLLTVAPQENTAAPAETNAVETVIAAP